MDRSDSESSRLAESILPSAQKVLAAIGAPSYADGWAWSVPCDAFRYVGLNFLLVGDGVVHRS